MFWIKFSRGPSVSMEDYFRHQHIISDSGRDGQHPTLALPFERPEWRVGSRQGHMSLPWTWLALSTASGTKDWSWSCKPWASETSSLLSFVFTGITKLYPELGHYPVRNSVPQGSALGLILSNVFQRPSAASTLDFCLCWRLYYQFQLQQTR